MYTITTVTTTATATTLTDDAIDDTVDTTSDHHHHHDCLQIRTPNVSIDAATTKEEEERSHRSGGTKLVAKAKCALGSIEPGRHA